MRRAYKRRSHDSCEPVHGPTSGVSRRSPFKYHDVGATSQRIHVTRVPISIISRWSMTRVSVFQRSINWLHDNYIECRIERMTDFLFAVSSKGIANVPPRYVHSSLMEASLPATRFQFPCQPHSSIDAQKWRAGGWQDNGISSIDMSLIYHNCLTDDRPVILQSVRAKLQRC